MGRSGQRTNYDDIGHLYDSQPYRTKEPDPDLQRMVEQQGSASRPLRALDLGCGTGNQQVANLRAFGRAVSLVGADLFRGMLRQAVAKSRDVSWVQCDGAVLPFASGSFDYVSDQYSLHHVQDKRGLFAEVLRVLRPGGRFVLLNVSPEGMRDCAMFRYFPTAIERDLVDFLPNAAHEVLLREVGFVDVEVQLTTRRFDRRLEEFEREVRRRDTNSHVMGLSDADYEAGLRRIASDKEGGVQTLSDCVCLLAARGTKPRSKAAPVAP